MAGWHGAWQTHTEQQDLHCRQERQFHRATILPKKHLLIFLFPLPTSFMCFGTSGTHNSRVNNQTSSTTWAQICGVKCASNCWTIEHELNKSKLKCINSFHPNMIPIFTDSQDWEKKMSINAHFHPLLIWKYLELRASRLTANSPVEYHYTIAGEILWNLFVVFQIAAISNQVFINAQIDNVHFKKNVWKHT